MTSIRVSSWQLTAAGGLQELVDAVVISDKIGQVKPSAGAFNAALQAVAAAANSTTMVGDDLEVDVEAALAAGFARAV
jgi:HAD superfamily hydrolase (TIGR01549 family)